jgi:hypothetical protein
MRGVTCELWQVARTVNTTELVLRRIVNDARRINKAAVLRKFMSAPSTCHKIYQAH